MESIKNNANKGNSNKREMNLKPPDPKKTLYFLFKKKTIY